MEKRKYVLGGVCILGCLLLLMITDYWWMHKIQPQKKEEEKVEVIDDYVIFWEEDEVPLEEGDIDAEQSYVVLSEMLAKVPPKILNQFYADNWGFDVSSANLSEQFFGGAYAYVRAVTDPEKKTIWLAQNDIAIRQSAIHEIGHYIQVTRGNPHETDAFLAIFRAEKYSFVVVDGDSRQASLTAKEYFAEAFQETILQPESMQIHAPLTYQYMTTLINNF